MKDRILELHQLFCRRQSSDVRVVDGWRETVEGFEGTDAALLTSPAPTLADVERVKAYVAAEVEYAEKQNENMELQALRIVPLVDIAASMKAQFNAHAEGKTLATLPKGDWIYKFVLHRLPWNAFVDDDARIDFRDGAGGPHPGESAEQRGLSRPSPGVPGEGNGAVVPTLEEILAILVAVRRTLNRNKKFFSGLEGMEPREVDRATYATERAAVDARLNELFSVLHACRMDAGFPKIISQCAGLIYFNLRARGPVDCVGRADASTENLALLKALEITEPDFELEWFSPDASARLVNDCIPGTEPFEEVTRRQSVAEFEAEEAIVQERMDADARQNAREFLR